MQDCSPAFLVQAGAQSAFVAPAHDSLIIIIIILNLSEPGWHSQNGMLSFIADLM